MQQTLQQRTLPLLLQKRSVSFSAPSASLRFKCICIFAAVHRRVPPALAQIDAAAAMTEAVAALSGIRRASRPPIVPVQRS